MDKQENGQVNLYIYDPKTNKCNECHVAYQLCKKIEYPLNVRNIINVDESEVRNDINACLFLYGIQTTDEEGDIKKSPIYSVILVDYQSLCSSQTPECIWFKWFGFSEPQKVYTLENDRIRDLVKACNVIEKKSVTFPPVILSGFNGADMEKRDVERILNSNGIPDNWTIYLDKNGENERLENLDFNINYLIRTFWR